MSQRDYYEILAVQRTATPDEIKKAYRRLAMEHHPDRNPGDKHAEERFKEASEAYEVLSDAHKREVYDRYGHQGVQGQGFAGVDDIYSSFGDIFDELFGEMGFGARRGRSGPRPRHGDHLRADVTISLEEAGQGIEKELSIDRTTACASCRGSGATAKGRETCKACDGTGQVTARQGFFLLQTTCVQCRGEGWRVIEPCPDCRGRGLVRVKRKLNVKIPAGVEDEMQLVLRGEGEGGVHGGHPGDLYVVIHVTPHPHFERRGDDLWYRAELSFVHVALGTRLTVPTLYGNHELDIPAGTDPGSVLHLKGQGIPNLRSGRKGEQCVEIVVRTPKKLSKRQRQLLEEFARAT